MHRFSYWYEGLIFILIFLVIMAIPCVVVALLGTKLIRDLGQYPSKSAQLQMQVAGQLLMTAILSFGMLTVFFRFFSD